MKQIKCDQCGKEKPTYQTKAILSNGKIKVICFECRVLDLLEQDDHVEETWQEYRDGIKSKLKESE